MNMFELQLYNLNKTFSKPHMGNSNTNVQMYANIVVPTISAAATYA